MKLLITEINQGLGASISKASSKIKRRVKNPLFFRVNPSQLPWFVVEIYDSDLDPVTLANKKGAFMERTKFSFHEMNKIWGFSHSWMLSQSPGVCFSGYHETDIWLRVKMYPGYLNLKTACQ